MAIERRLQQELVDADNRVSALLKDVTDTIESGLKWEGEAFRKGLLAFAHKLGDAELVDALEALPEAQRLHREASQAFLEYSSKGR